MSGKNNKNSAYDLRLVYTWINYIKMAFKSSFVHFFSFSYLTQENIIWDIGYISNDISR